jgi:uncharacterized membrane protein YebE (DUF533 family)
MFDAKSILDALVKGGSAPQAAPTSGGGDLGGLGDLLGGLLKGQGGGAGGGLGDILGKLGQGGGAGGASQGGGLDDLLRQMVPGSGGGGSAGSGGGGLGDILGKLGQGGGAGGAGGGLGDILGKLGQGGGAGGAGGGLGDILGKLGQGGGAGGAGGGLGDILGEMFGQAKQGAREGAERVGDATGAREALEKMSGGKSADDIMRQLKDLVANNQLGAGAALGGLGALILGTQTGRSVAVSAAKLGALALIGGLAYRAYQNYAQDKPVGADRNFTPEAAPPGSGFEPDAASNEQAALYIRTMIAAASADGRIDATEQQRILGSLGQVGLAADAEEFLANELNNPATAADIAGAVSSGEQAVQVYTAARIAIDPDTRGEQAFLMQLAGSLGIDEKLKAHLDQAAKAA